MDKISESIIMMHGRRSGYTFRTLLKALHAASDGDRVIVSASNRRIAECLFRKAMDICAAYMEPPEFSKTRLQINMPGDGVVYFLSRQNPDAGRGLQVKPENAFCDL